MIDRTGFAMIGDDGKRRFTPLIEFATREIRSRWSDSVVAALRAAFPEALAVQAAAAESPRAAATWEAPDDEIPF